MRYNIDSTLPWNVHLLIFSLVQHRHGHLRGKVQPSISSRILLAPGRTGSEQGRICDKSPWVDANPGNPQHRNTPHLKHTNPVVIQLFAYTFMVSNWLARFRNHTANFTTVMRVFPASASLLWRCKTCSPPLLRVRTRVQWLWFICNLNCTPSRLYDVGFQCDPHEIPVNHPFWELKPETNRAYPLSIEHSS